MTTFKLKWPITFSCHTWLTMRFPYMSKFPILVSFHIIHFFHNLLNKVVLEPQVSHENTSKYVDTVIVFVKTWTKGNWPLDDLWPNICWEVLCVTLPKDHCVQVPWEYIYVCGYMDQFCKWPTKGHWLLDDLWPHICWGLMCDSTQGSLCPSPMKIHQSMWMQWPFFFEKKKNLNQRSLMPRWPLTPHLLRSHVWLYPRIIVSKSHENTSKYVDTVTLFAKTWSKDHWPLDDLWPNICWGHMCDSTQGSLFPSPMGIIHQCMWIQWPILQIYHIHTTYYIHTYYVQNQWSQSLSGKTKKYHDWF